MRTWNPPLVFILALGLTACSGCSSGSGSGGGSAGSGNFSLRITDAPFPVSFVEEASVEIESVEVRDSNGPWVTVYSTPTVVDLIPLRGGVSRTLVTANLPAGTYDEVRLIVGTSGRVVLDSSAVVAGSTHEFSLANGNLKFPSGMQSGIKVKVDPPIVVSTRLSADLILDFALDQNFVFNGPFDRQPGVRRVLFTPTVRAINSSTEGRVVVDVMSDNGTPSDAADDFPLDGATVSADDGAGATASTQTDASGHAELPLTPGTWDITVSATGHDSQTLMGQTIVVANVTDLGDVTLESSAGEIAGQVSTDAATPSDTTDDLVLEGATVEAMSGTTVMASVTTDAQGRFQLTGLASGSYDLRVVADGHATGTLASVATGASGNVTPVDVTLMAFTRNVTGTLTDSQAMPVSGASLTIERSDGLAIQSSTTLSTASDGSYVVELATGSYALTFDDGSSAVTITVDVVGTDPVSDLSGQDAQLP